MKSIVPFRHLACTLWIVSLLAGCGYYFPHIYDGPPQAVYMPTWKNRTSKLGLDAKIYQNISRWFQKSKTISLTKERDGADLILAGEIVSIDLPSISWGEDARSKEGRVRLTVRYILKDLQRDEILWEVPNQVWSEEFSTTGGATNKADSEEDALAQIVDDLSEKIYLGTLERIRRRHLLQPDNAGDAGSTEQK